MSLKHPAYDSEPSPAIKYLVFICMAHFPCQRKFTSVFSLTCHRTFLVCMIFLISKCIWCWMLTVSTQHIPALLSSSWVTRSWKPKNYIFQIPMSAGFWFYFHQKRHSCEMWEGEEKQKPLLPPRHRQAGELLRQVQAGSVAGAPIHPSVNHPCPHFRQLRSLVVGLELFL